MTNPQQQEKSFEQKVINILFDLYLIPEHLINTTTRKILKAHNASLERIEKKIDKIEIDLFGVEPDDTFKLQAMMDTILRAKEILKQERGELS